MKLWVTLWTGVEFNVCHCVTVLLSQQLVLQNTAFAKSCCCISCDCWFVGIENRDVYTVMLDSA